VKNIENVIIILGSPNDDDGTLSNIAQSRCEKTYEKFLQVNSEGHCFVLATGGFGEHFNRTNTAHAEYTKQYIIELGIPENAFLEAVLSSHTVEDAVFSKRVLKDYIVDNIYVVTTDYHVERVKFIFESVYGSDFNINMVSATAMLPKIEQDRLIAHEKQALAGLKKNGIIYEGL